MLKSGSGNPRVHHGPQARDFLTTPRPPEPNSAQDQEGAEKPGDAIPPEEIAREITAKTVQFSRADGRSRRPEPRIPGKHALNPPIVTIFGAGISGLTAAHELVDRGFIVQVVEAAEDPSCPGRPHIGGLAANQFARVRANIEDLHRDLIAVALTDPANATQKVERDVAAWLLKVFAFNRSRWIETEDPARINGCIFSMLDNDEGREFRKALFADLRAARERYRKRWLWDLVVRGVRLGAIVPVGQNQNPFEHAVTTYKKLLEMDTLPIAVELAAYLAPSHMFPKTDQIVDCETGVIASIEREFFCFRLVPYARRGFAGAEEKARELYAAWVAEMAKDPQLEYSCLSCPTKVAAGGIARASDGTPVPVHEGEASPDFPHLAWLEVEVVEQRLPGEHGYRFFPSFYRHLDDTMGRIPLYANGVPTSRSVRDNLKPTLLQGIGLSAEDKAWIVEHQRDPRRAYLEKKDPNQRDPRYPSYDDPVPRECDQPVEGTVVELDREMPRSFEALRNCSDRFVRRVGGTRRDAVLLLAKLLRYLTSSPERRRAEYEGTNWAKFVRIDGFSKVFQFHIQSAAQSLLAFSAAEADARTYGNIALQMMLDELRDGTRVDRTLNGPTSDVWLEPWREHLQRQGVRFFHGSLKGLTWQAKPRAEGAPIEYEVVPNIEISGKDVWSGQGLELLRAEISEPALQPDFYVLALNVEQSLEKIRNLVPTTGLSEGAFKERAPDFARMLEFDRAIKEIEAKKEGSVLRNMTGIQYFFDAKTAIGHGHLYFPFSKWGLSSISQSEFWSARGGFADGYFGLLSVDVCTTGAPKANTLGAPDKASPQSFTDTLAKATDGEGPLSVAETTLEQIAHRSAIRGPLSAPRCYHVDRNSLDPNGPRFLASVVGLDGTRPGRPGGCVGPKEIRYSVDFDRWVVCGTFMATHTRMTTMESANESARHAVAAILEKLRVRDAAAPVRAEVDKAEYHIENLVNKTYNWASDLRTYEAPPTWNPEDDEIPDFDFFRRVDRRLVDAEVPHFMDVINFDRKLEHALDAIDIYGEERPLSELFGLSAANLDAAFTRELGPGYHGLAERRAQEGQGAKTSQRFPDMGDLQERLKEVFDVFSNLIRDTRTADVPLGFGRAPLRRK